MIQAPSLQYIPAQQTAQQAYMPQGANTPVQYTNQAPGVIYNYPIASSYSTPAYYTPQQRPQYNGVNIEINGPQGQGYMPNTMPAQYIPAQFIQTPQFVPFQQPMAQQPMVQQPVLNQPAIQQPAAQQPFIPAEPINNQPPQAVPAPQIQQPQEQTPAAATPVIDNPQAVDQNMTPASFAGRLKTNDLNAQKQTIEEIAEKVKYDDKMAPVLLDTQIFDALFEIVDKDNSSLEGPSPEILELRKKPEQELTEEEKAKAKTPAPIEEAEINKQYALYTISYLQEALNKELEKRGGKALELKDLPGIDKVVDTVKSNASPMVRVAGIAALSHIARPEYKADLTTIFELAKNDEDPSVKEAAERALSLLK